MRKRCALILCLLLAAPCAASAESVDGHIVYGPFVYALAGDGTAAIVDYTGTAFELTVPDTLDGHPVAAIGEFAFNTQDNQGRIAGGLCENLSVLRLPDSVSHIADWAFCYCTTLKTIVLPEEVSFFGSGVFYGCDQLLEVTVPRGAAAIGDETFLGCANLLSAALPDGVTSIGKSAFTFCRKLKEVNIPEGVASIGQSAFAFCSALTQLHIPESVLDIGPQVFSFCDNLTLKVREGSQAHQYAQSKGIPIEPVTD